MAVILDWCSTCKHIRPNKDGWIMNCDAFTEEIPDDFVFSDPRELKECNNGVRYEPIENKKKQPPDLSHEKKP